MGLLSDPEYGSPKWVKVLKKIHAPVCYLCYISAIAWFVMLGNREFNNETYFSENALLPGLVTNEFNGEYVAKQFYNEFTQELEDKYEDSDKMPVPWLVAKMSQLHLEVYTHNFTLSYPLGGKGHMYKGTNVYGILRAPRTSSLEALVVTAPYRALSNHQKGTTAGIALMLAFAQFARPQKYWAKDIIFLITEHEQLGMQAWLEAYHGLQSNPETFYTSLGGFWKPGTFDLGKLRGFSWGDHQRCLNPGKLKGRSGSIQAAINLEFHTPKIKYVEVKVEGLNGQLPNLDLVNLVHKLCVKSGIHHSYKNSYSWIRTRNKMEDWTNSLYTMMGMISTQMAGVPNGNHGLFHRFNIEAVTLEGRDATDAAGIPPKVNALSTANFHRLGVALESILRSLNNLLERFHQSYFFYLLAATNRFISIGQYMPSLCLMCVAMLVRALYLWVSIQDEEDTSKHTDKHADKKQKGKQAKTDKESDSEVPGDDNGETVLRKRNVKKTEKESNELPEDVTKKSKGKESDSEVPGDDNGETVLRKRNIKKTEKESNELPADATKKSAKSIKNDELSDTEVPGDEELKAVRYIGYIEDYRMNVVNIGANYLLVHLIGYGMMNTPIVFSYIGASFDLPPEYSVYYCLTASSVLLALITPYLPRLLSKSPLTREEMILVNILLLVELATVCLTVGMHNFPLGLILATLYTPLALIVDVRVKTGKKTSVIPQLLKRALCVLVHPLLFVSLGMLAYSRVLFPEDSVMETMSRARDAVVQAVMFSIVDSFIFGNWLFNMVTSALLPIWILFWQLLCNHVVINK